MRKNEIKEGEVYCVWIGKDCAVKLLEIRHTLRKTLYICKNLETNRTITLKSCGRFKYHIPSEEIEIPEPNPKMKIRCPVCKKVTFSTEIYVTGEGKFIAGQIYLKTENVDHVVFYCEW